MSWGIPMTTSRLRRALRGVLPALAGAILGVISTGIAVAQEWKQTGDPLIPRLRTAEFITDAEPAVLEAQVENGGAPYTYTVDWEDGSDPESGRSTASSLRLTHDYDLISSFQVRLTVTLGERTSKLEPLLITVSDDDDDVPRLVWNFPSPVVRQGQRAVVGWSITDPSGLAFVSVVIQGPRAPSPARHAPRPVRRERPGTRQLRHRGADARSRRRPARRRARLHGDRDHHRHRRSGRRRGPRLPGQLSAVEQSQPEGPRRRRVGDSCDPCPDTNGRCETVPRPPAAGGSAAAAGLPLAWRRARRRRRAGLLVVSFLLPALAAAAPSISSLRPEAVLLGEPVVIIGTGFGSAQGQLGRVTFGGVDAGTVLVWTDTRITVEVPMGSLVGGARRRHRPG